MTPSQRLVRPVIWVSVICLAGAPAAAADGGSALLGILHATLKIANKDSTGTCFIVSRPGGAEGSTQRILVTAGHVLEKMAGDQCRLVVRQKQADGTFVRREVPLNVRQAGKPLWRKHPQADVAALPLPADLCVSAISIEQIADKTVVERGGLQTGDEVWLLCYPVQLESSEEGFPVLRQGVVASFPLGPLNRHKTYLVDCSTFAGDSGGPVFVRKRQQPGRAADGPLVVGLVLGQHLQTVKTVSPIEQRTVHRPLGLAIVIHAEFVRQTIDLLSR